MIILQAENMLTIIKDLEAPLEKKMTAVNNLIVLARERVGADIIMSLKGVTVLYQTMKLLKNEEFSHSCVRIFGEVCKRGSEQSLLVVRTLGKESTCSRQ